MEDGERKKPWTELVRVLLLGINSTEHITLLFIYSVLSLFTILIYNNYMGKGRRVFEDTVYLMRCLLMDCVQMSRHYVQHTV